MEWYVRNLISELAKLDTRNEYLLVTAPNNYRTFELPSERWRMLVYSGVETSPTTYQVAPRRLPIPRYMRVLSQMKRSIWRVLRSGIPTCTNVLADVIQRERLDIWFCPIVYALPVGITVPIVVTVPDLQQERYPQFFPESQLAQRAMGYQHSCRIATATLAISDHVADELLRVYGLERERVFATPLGVNADCHITEAAAAQLADAARLKFRLDHPFVYYPANGWVHKNHERLVQALAIVRARGVDLSLLLSGEPFDVLDRLRPLLRRDLRRAVRHLGYVNRPDVLGLYRAATMVAVPSLFEGFGLTVLEAMSLGTPVACSAIESLQSVAGDAALYFDPERPASIADALCGLLAGDVRERLIAAGRSTARRFTYAHTGARTLQVFEHIGSGSLRPPSLPPFRPLVSNFGLDDGSARWYFHCRALREIHFEVRQPAPVAALRTQSVEVRLNGRPIFQSPVHGKATQKLLIPVDDSCSAPAGFHCLELSAAVRLPTKRSVLSLRVPSLAIVDGDGRRLQLTP